MSFFNAIKRSLGFGEDIDDGLLKDSADSVSDETSFNDYIEVSEEKELPNVETNPDMVTSIFNHVVETFNNALPDFLRNAVDPDAQKKQLYESLDASLKTYLDEITAQTRQRCELKWASEQTSMRGEMENLKAKAKEIEQQRFDIKQQQLSSDRQRRALNDRVRDLESQLDAFQAEREQLDLENKSLINKLKVAGVYETEVENLRNDLNDARAQILALRNGNGDTSDAENTLASDRIAELEGEIERLTDQLANATEKDRISTEMMNGLQSKASSARSELEKKDKEITELKARLDEAENLQKDIEKINEQMTLIESAIEKRDRKISKLKETCEALRNENTELRDTIAANLKNNAETEELLRNRIQELEADPTTPIAVSDLIKSEAVITESDDCFTVTPKISDGDIAMIEENFDTANWLSSEPTETPSMRKGISEAEFGYQAPVKKTPAHDNDAQLSLF